MDEVKMFKETRRGFLAGSAAVGASGLLPAKTRAATEDKTIRPFRINISEEQLVDLRRRIKATRWPDRETVVDQSQGVQLTKIQELVRYWGADYDWRKVEAQLNALPQFMTEIEGLDTHFIHVRSRHKNALPVIITHGWPGSIIEQLKIIGPLTDPPAHGGSAEDAYPVSTRLRLLWQTNQHRLSPTAILLHGAEKWRNGWRE